MRYLTALTIAGGLAMAACNNAEYAYVPLYVPSPDFDEDAGTCMFNAMGDPAIDITMDVQYARILDMVTIVENRLDPVEVMLGGQNQGENIKIPRSIQPLRFDFQWECESTGFQGGVGPIVLPAFSVDKPFCLDKRENVTGDIGGVDVVPASGEPVGPGDRGFVSFTPVPAQLGQAFFDFFEVARLSQKCCDEVGGDCADVGTGSGADCTALQDAFDALAGPQRLSAKQPADVQRFRGFSTYVQSGARYPVRISGFIEGLLPTGDLIVSSRFNREVELCSGGIPVQTGMGTAATSCADGGAATICLSRAFQPPSF